jgi:hypothetical protein
VSARSVLAASSAPVDRATTGPSCAVADGPLAVLEGLASGIYGLPGALLILALVAGFV